ncbi:MAG: dihydropyrimidinase [candidate division Zixibacteria bacterium]|nr:dihydropyrimidinase [candidate division Zixibacteria bacterium]
MDLKITGGRIVTAEGTYKADIGINKGKITAIADKLPNEARTTISAKGKIVFPGAIDVHVHLQLPFCGTVSADDFENGTKAAACGGVTTVIDFAIQKKGETLKKTVAARRAEADGKVSVDYALHAVPTDWSEKTKGELFQLADSGYTTFKMFMIYAREGMISDDDALFAALEETAGFGGMVGVHAESVRVLDLLLDRYHNKQDMKKYGAYCHVLSRPNFIESEAIQRAVNWAEATGGKLYIVHMSTAEGADIISDAKKRGLNVYAETCPQYLLLDDSVFKKPNGHLYGTCPQVKKKADSDRLWEAMAAGDVSVVATDTCTFNKKQKAMWKGDFTKIPFGMPGVETLLPLMYSYGVGKKRITESQLVKLICTNPAKLMGMYPEKGNISIGADADLVVFDPHRKVTLSHKNLQTNCDWSPFEGFKLKGYPDTTISRGQVVAIQGVFVGDVGSGRFVKRHIGMNLK